MHRKSIYVCEKQHAGAIGKKRGKFRARKERLNIARFCEIDYLGRPGDKEKKECSYRHGA
jgi:hypothetical protein